MMSRFLAALKRSRELDTRPSRLFAHECPGLDGDSLKVQLEGWISSDMPANWVLFVKMAHHPMNVWVGAPVIHFCPGCGIELQIPSDEEIERELESKSSGGGT